MGRNDVNIEVVVITVKSLEVKRPGEWNGLKVGQKIQKRFWGSTGKPVWVGIDVQEEEI